MLFVSISFASGSQCKRSFWGNIGSSIIENIVINPYKNEKYREMVHSVLINDIQNCIFFDWKSLMKIFHAEA